MTEGRRPLQRLVVTAIRTVAQHIQSYELRAPEKEPLLPFDAGAHIDVHLAPGLVRQYSLCNSPEDKHRYLIAVKLEPQGEGGSRFIHEQIEVGAQLHVSAPRNQFQLADTTEESILIGGGIGLTPLWSMAQQLQSQGRPWRAYLYARSPERAPFHAEFNALGTADKVVWRFAPGRDETLYIPELQSSQPRHYYCCGPASMLQAFERSTHGLNPQYVHTESFNAAEELPTDEKEFELVLARSQRIIRVGGGETVLDAIRKAGIALPCSCRQGYCGTCEVGVLAGEVDHRDTVLNEAERTEQRAMMVCVSRAKSPSLKLDL
jgi:ferredoxin-NADP reductase